MNKKIKSINQIGSALSETLVFITFLLIFIFFANGFNKLEFNSPILNNLNSISSNKVYKAPNQTIADLATKATMTEKAKQIFYSTNPQIDTNRTLFNEHCKAPLSGSSVELGCYTSDNRIYILNISQPQLQNEMVVVAAHEMLHAVYARMSDSERAQIDQEIQAELPKIEDPNLASELKIYQQTEPGQEDNELHSILGTEYYPLSPQLDTYYSQYFSNRKQLVSNAQNFNNIFSDLQNTMNQLLIQIKSMKRGMFSDLRQGNISEYNSQVPQLRTLVDTYNKDVVEYNDLSRSLVGTQTFQVK